MTEEALVTLCIKGDRKGQNALYQRYVSPMGRLCLRYLSEPDDAREIITKGFLKVFSHIHKFKFNSEGSLEGWIRKIMVNECLMHLRKRKIVFVDIIQNDPGTEDTIDDDLSAEEIFKIVAGLPDGYRTIFNLFAIEGYSHQEISSMLGISESSSRSQLTHARGYSDDKTFREGF